MSGRRLVRVASSFVLVAAGCRVDDAYLDTTLYACEEHGDCGEGWGCLRSAPYAVDFCAPGCDNTTCDGICVGGGDEGSLCLRGCRIREDGTASACPGEGLECIRVSLESDDGVCYPVEVCSADDPCSGTGFCLSSIGDLAIQLLGHGRADRFYCIPTPDPLGECPTRSTPVSLGGDEEICLATCEPPDLRCPPGAGCMRQFALVGAPLVPCFPGLYGVPCEDDSNCLLGRCLDTGDAGRLCTVTCEDADLLAGGCQNLPTLGSFTFYNLECYEGFCAPRYEIGGPCEVGSLAYRCADGLDCRRFPVGSGEIVDLCSKDCDADADCNPGFFSRNFCLRLDRTGPGSCFTKFGTGGPCLNNLWCASGQCDLRTHQCN